jgi:hypothetical protein
MGIFQPEQIITLLVGRESVSGLSFFMDTHGDGFAATLPFHFLKFKKHAKPSPSRRPLASSGEAACTRY